MMLYETSWHGSAILRASERRITMISRDLAVFGGKEDGGGLRSNQGRILWREPFQG